MITLQNVQKMRGKAFALRSQKRVITVVSFRCLTGFGNIIVLKIAKAFEHDMSSVSRVIVFQMPENPVMQLNEGLRIVQR